MNIRHEDLIVICLFGEGTKHINGAKGLLALQI
jgi:hypothetical protein